MWSSQKRLVLASASSARSNVLKAAGLIHIVSPADMDERATERQLQEKSPQSVALSLAEAKALHVARKFPNEIVIGADQTLECEGRLFHKPANLADARSQLLELAGKTHKLHSGLAAVRDGHFVEYSEISTAHLKVRSFSAAFLDEYLRLADRSILQSVGCYQIEGLGAHLFEKIEGDQFTVMGLPLIALLSYFRRAGYLKE